jgi:hypothetical protein
MPSHGDYVEAWPIHKLVVRRRSSSPGGYLGGPAAQGDRMERLAAQRGPDRLVAGIQARGPHHVEESIGAEIPGLAQQFDMCLVAMPDWLVFVAHGPRAYDWAVIRPVTCNRCRSTPVTHLMPRRCAHPEPGARSDGRPTTTSSSWARRCSPRSRDGGAHDRSRVPTTRVRPDSRTREPERKPRGARSRGWSLRGGHGEHRPPSQRIVQEQRTTTYEPAFWKSSRRNPEVLPPVKVKLHD